MSPVYNDTFRWYEFFLSPDIESFVVSVIDVSGSMKTEKRSGDNGQPCLDPWCSVNV